MPVNILLAQMTCSWLQLLCIRNIDDESIKTKRFTWIMTISQLQMSVIGNGNINLVLKKSVKQQRV